MKRFERTRLAPAVLLAVAVVAASPGHATVLARKGEAKYRIIVPADPTPQEETASRELAAYLGRVASASFEVLREREGVEHQPALFVGNTVRAKALEISAATLGPEEWLIRRAGPDVVLVGGHPRGTLYAVYRFLEDRVGVRWWTPFAETVPSSVTLRVKLDEDHGEPTFSYRDVHGIKGPREYLARNRVNGHFAKLPWEYGGTVAYGPPYHAHTFNRYVDPEIYFGDHPEYFSEIEGIRTGEYSQLCLTNDEVIDLIVSKLRTYVEQTREKAAATGEPAPTLFGISPNDWARPCQCARCAAVRDREGAESGPLLAFVNRVAEAVAEDYPDVWIDTLAYYYAVEPPREVRPRENVVIRLSVLINRDFSKGIADPGNREQLEIIEDWAAIAPNLWIWDYTVTFGKDGDLPLPNLRYLASDYRLYANLGVEGIFVQHEHPVRGDLRDLKMWVLVKLLEDPYRDPRMLIREFADGFYGPAGKYVRRYLRLLENAADQHPHVIGHRADAAAFVYVDSELVTGGARLFDRAERAVAGNPDLVRRVRHARLSLDWAALLRWNAILDEWVSEGREIDDFPLDPGEIARRVLDVWKERTDARLPLARRDKSIRWATKQIEGALERALQVTSSR